MANFPTLAFPCIVSTDLIYFLAKFSDRSKRSEVQVFDDHLSLLWSRLFLDVPGCLLGAPLVPAGHDDPRLELQQLPGQGLPYPAVSPGHNDRLSSHGVGGIPEQYYSFLREKTTHKQQYATADNSGNDHRSVHESGDR